MRNPFLLCLAATALVGCSEYDLSPGKDVNEESGPEITVEPLQLYWPGVAFGDSEVKNFSIRNDGTDDLRVEGAQLEGAGTFVINGGVFPAVLSPGEEMWVDVAFVPDSSTEDSAIVNVLSNDADEPTVPVELLGLAGTPALEVTPGAWDFGDLPAACNSALTVTMTNVGTAMLTVSDISQAGTGFALDDLPDLPFELMPGESDTVEVVWTPLSTGAFAGEISVASDDPTGIKTATQVGTAIEAADCLPVNEGGNGEYTLSFTAEYQYADVAFLLDTTGSMSGLAQAMASEFASITTDLAAVIPDITFGVATYDDYPTSSFGSYGDLPFQLRQQQTSSLSSVQSVLNSVPIHSGGDQEESTVEALYQAATGNGYDMNCNRSVDSASDVPPFIAYSGDAYGGAASGIYNSAVPGTGTLGGMGFRDGTLPIIIYATDAPFRDPEGGYGSPGGCYPAGMSSAISALNGINARVIGVGVLLYGYSYFNVGQMNAVATGTSSYGDMDGNGTTEPAVVTWNGASSTFRNTITNAVQGLVDGATFDEIRLDIYGDDLGIVQSVTPEAYYGVASGDTTDFTLDIRGEAVEGPGDEVVMLELVLVGVLPTGGELTLQRSNLYVVLGD